jgi:kynurenine formamidase
MIIIENLKDTDELTGKEFTLHAFPLNITGGDGSPVRAVAVLP